MMLTTKCTKQIQVVAALTLAVAVPVWAHGPGRIGGRGPRGESPGSLLFQLIYPCQADCSTTARTCAETADVEATNCITAACSTEIGTAQTECAADRTAQACADAVTALRTCGTTCLTTRGTTLSDCRDTFTTCRDACAATTE